MKISINAPKVIQLPPTEFNLLAHGHKNELSNSQLHAGDRIRIKEHNGNHYTGHEITAVVTSAQGNEATIKKFSITHDEKIGKQNKRDVGRKSRQNNTYNSYI